MKYIGVSKIGKLSAKGIAYPQLRLPREYSNIIGQVADVIETKHNGKRAFLIVPNDSTVLKPSPEVLKPESKKPILNVSETSNQKLETLSTL